MVVLDASALIEWLLQTTAGLRIQLRVSSTHDSMHAPHLLDIEVTHVLRRFVRARLVPERRAEEALDFLRDFQITRYPHIPFLPRIWQYRHTVAAYDAAYLVLAEALDASLLTHDERLASAHGHSVKIELF